MTIEELDIQLQADANNATQSLDKLRDVLENLKKIGQDNGLDLLYKKLHKLSTLDMDKGSAKSLGGIEKRLSKLTTGIDKTSRKFDSIKKKISETTAAAGKYNDTVNGFGASGEQSKPKKKISSDDKSSLAGSTAEQSKTLGFFAKVKDSINNIGAVKKIKELKAEGKDVETKGATLAKKIKGLFTRLLFYAAVRGIMRSIRDGLQNIAYYGTEANKVLTQYNSLSLQTKNSIAAATLPLLQQVYPLVESLAQSLIKVANALNIVASKINGSSTYVRANTKYVQDYAKSLGKLKNSMASFDEINTIGNVYDYSKMFETVDISGSDVTDSAWNLVGAGTTLLGIVSTFAGFKLMSKVKSLDTGLGKLGKTLAGAGGVVVGMKLAYDAASKLTKVLSSDNHAGLGGAIIGLVGGVGLSAAGGAIIGGPVGALIGGLAGVVGGLAGVFSAQTEMRLEMLRTDYYNIQGTSITVLTGLLNNYFAALDFDKQSEWIQKIKDTQSAYDDALTSYDTMWLAVSKRKTLNTDDITKLAEAFNSLAAAAKAVNDVKINSLMASISTGIKMNITDELTERLGNLVGKLSEAQALIDSKITGISTEYQNILNDVAKNGGVMSAEQKSKLTGLRTDMTKFTLSDDTSTARWNIEIDEALKGAINAGTDKDRVLANVKDLMGDKDTYLNDLKTKYATDLNTLEQLIELDRTEFGGQLGFSVEDIATLKTSYESQVEAVKSKYNSVLDQIIDTYSSGMLDYEQFHSSAGLRYWTGTWQEYDANKELSEEQKELLDTLRSYLPTGYVSEEDAAALSKRFDDVAAIYTNKFGAELGNAVRESLRKITGYATGGFPEDGLFMANSTELVGKFSNGRTAVANNNQIIEGIKRGVIEANQESGSGNGGNWIIQLVDTDGNVKSETIISAAERRNRRDGKTVIPVGI